MFDYFGIVAEKKFNDNKKIWIARVNFLGFNLSGEISEKQAETLKKGQLVKALVIGTPKAKDNYAYIMPEVVGIEEVDMKELKKLTELPVAKITVINAKTESLHDKEKNETISYASMQIAGELGGTFTGTTDFVDNIKNWGKYEIELNIINKKGVVQIYPSNFKEIEVKEAK